MKLEITLKRDSWHCKLQTMMFGQPEFQNFCPYFWLTIFCIMASPFFFTFQAIKQLAIFVVVMAVAAWHAARPVIENMAKYTDHVFKTLDKSICIPIEEHLMSFMSDEKIKNMYERSRYYNSYDNKERPDESDGKLFKKFIAWMDNIYDDYDDEHKKRRKKRLRIDAKFQVWKDQQGDGWRDRIERVLARIEDERVREIERKNAKIKARNGAKIRSREACVRADKRRKAMLNAIVTVTRLVVPWMLGALGLAAAYLLYVLGLIIYAWDWAAIFKAAWGCWVWLAHGAVKVLWPLIKISPIVALIVGVIMLIVRTIRKCDLTLPFTIRLPAWLTEDRNVSYLAKPFIVVMDFIGNVFRFIRDGVIMFKKDYCPQISWITSEEDL